ncbi:MAG TPA: tetratricopeptide repeat protein, partial [Arenimonas sp.]|nr:tetratricopeptide repeat protein [Arenimonas sp.]
QSMFYTNLAGEAMAENRYREAFWLLKAALEQDPAHVGALNSLAVLHRRTGNEATAEAIYRHALDRYGDTPNLLSNYRALLLMQGREAEVADLDRRLALLPIRNPFDLVELGNYAYFQGRHQEALDFYEQAQAEAPYLHEVYWRQAVVYHSLGKLERAEKLLMTAATTAARTSDKRLYQAKALSLQGHAEHCSHGKHSAAGPNVMPGPAPLRCGRTRVGHRLAIPRHRAVSRPSWTSIPTSSSCSAWAH